MLRLKNASRILATIFALMILFSTFHGTVRAQSDLDPIVVMFDAGHNPQHAADDETQGLKLMFDMVNASTRYIMRINEEPLNDTILDEVDILVIGAPDRSAEFEQEEVISITEMLGNGSSMLILGDPSVDQNSTYWLELQFQDLGENVGINTLLDQLNITGVRFSLNESTPGNIFGDTVFDYDHALNSSYASVIEFDQTTWDTTHPIFKDINSIVAMTSTLKPIGVASSVAKSYDTSFAQFRKGPNTFSNISFPNMSLADFTEFPLNYSAINGTFPTWMSAFEFDRSRIIISGSTLMYTGRLIDLPETERQWFYMGDNSRLFMNMLNWLSEETVAAPNAVTQMLMISSVVLFIGIVFYTVKKIR